MKTFFYVFYLATIAITTILVVTALCISVPIFILDILELL